MPKVKVDESLKSEDLLVPYEKKKVIVSILLILFSLLLSLSIFSYSTTDYANISELSISNFFSILDRNSTLSQDIARSQNWLGLIGAILSYILIHGTIGYFSLAIPVVIFLIGLTMLRNQEVRKTIFFINLILGVGILMATLFGILANSIDLIKNHKEIYGVIGAFLGEVSIRLLGGAGSLILITAMLGLTAYLILDIDHNKVIDLIGSFFRNAGSFLMNKFRRNATPAGQVRKVVPPTEPEKPRKKKSEIKIEKEDDEEESGKNKINPTPEITINKPEDGLDNIKPPAAAIIPDKKKKGTKAPVEPENTEDVEKTELSDEDKIFPWDEDLEFKSPPLDLLDQPVISIKVDEEELNATAEQLKSKLALFDIGIESISVTPGPVVTLFEIVPSPGVKISRIVSLQDDIALALAAKGIRIIAPIPGKSAIGIEIPNNKREMIVCKSIIGSNSYKEAKEKMELPLAIGKTTVGEIFVTDIAQMPHLLMAGATGSGKSVGINSLIVSLLYSKHPSDIKFAIIDPKKIELSFYKKLKHHFLAVCPDIKEEIVTNSQNALTLMKSVELEMDMRYDVLASCGVRHIKDYNQRLSSGRIISTEEKPYHKLPYIIVVVDELADLMMTAGKDIEEPIARIAQLARAVGIHLILATQRPSVDVITGTIKSNFTSRIAYQTASRIDSKTILDFNGAERLLGKGDMLFSPSGVKPSRLQNAFISVSEVERIVDYIGDQTGYTEPYQLPSTFESKSGGGGLLTSKDDLFEDAAYLVVRLKKCTVTLLQRKLKLGYARAARIVDELEEAGIVGPFDGSKTRLVLIDDEDQLRRLLDSMEEA